MKVRAYLGSFVGKSHNAFSVVAEGSYGEETPTVYAKTVYLRDVTTNLADLLALKYAILMVAEDPAEVDFLCSTSSAYLYGMFSKVDGEWDKDPKANIEMIEEIRQMTEDFQSFFVKVDKKHQNVVTAKAASKVKPTSPGKEEKVDIDEVIGEIGEDVEEAEVSDEHGMDRPTEKVTPSVESEKANAGAPGKTPV